MIKDKVKKGMILLIMMIQAERIDTTAEKRALMTRVTEINPQRTTKKIGNKNEANEDRREEDNKRNSMTN